MELKLNKWTHNPLGVSKILIVPYGIETAGHYIVSPRADDFNCTLWNWNDDISAG